MVAPAFNLVTGRWINCLDRDGVRHTVGLREVIERADCLCLTEPDPLLEASIWRLLAALCYASGSYPHDHSAYLAQIEQGIDRTTLLHYLDCHRDHFNLFDPVRPYGQDITLRQAIGTASVSPAIYLDLTAAISRPLLVDHRHLHNATPLTPLQALRALMVQWTWACGGRLRGSSKDLGGGASTTRGLTAPANDRIVLCPAGPTIAEGLSWRVVPTRAPGAPTWTYPEHPAADMRPFDGEATGLTWLSRRMLLVAGDHGDVKGVLVARGQSYEDLKAGAPPLGWSDLVSTDAGVLPGGRLEGSDDLLPVAAIAPRPGSLLAHARAAATALGRGIDLAAITLVVASRGQMKPLVVRRVPIPTAVLTTADAPDLARGLMTLRRAAAPWAPPASCCEDYLDWLHREDLDPTGLLGAARDRLLADARSRSAPHSQNAVARAWEIHAAARKAALALAKALPPTQKDTHTSVENLQAAPALGFDDDLFTTAASKPALSVEDDPAALLLRRLGGYRRLPQHRATLAGLRAYATRPDPANAAMAMAIRDLPVDHLHAGMTTAALFALSASGATPAHGPFVPLARLARSLGSTKRGPAHPHINALMRRAVTTPAAQLLPILVSLLQQRQHGRAQIHWSDLYRDLIRWDEPDETVRTRWTWLFHHNHPIKDIDIMLAKGSTR